MNAGLLVWAAMLTIMLLGAVVSVLGALILSLAVFGIVGLPLGIIAVILVSLGVTALYGTATWFLDAV